MVRVTSVRCLEGFTVELGFGDGATRTIDLRPFLQGPVFHPHRVSDEFFRSVRVDPRLGTLVWPNHTDLDPDLLRWDLEPAPYAGPPEDDSRDGDPSIQGIDHPVKGPEERTDPGHVGWFLGINVSVETDGQARPRLRAWYGEDEAVLRLDTLELQSGKLPARVLGYLREWAGLHHAELEEAWARARAGQPLRPIAPLT